MRGRIVKGVGGFYYVYVPEKDRVYECRARGIFRKAQIKPLVGDDVLLDILDEREGTGSITDIEARRNELVRPSVANIDQALIIFAMLQPSPNYNLLDRFLVMMERLELPSVICFNKQELASAGEKEEVSRIYEQTGYPLLFTSAKEGEGIDRLRQLLSGRTTAVAGPSGVGKSSLINRLCPEAGMEIGEISRKIQRGKHTTRHTQLFSLGKNSSLGENTYIMDTPGFSSFDLADMEKEELGRCYPEFGGYEEKCRFAGCSHIGEPDCGVKAALEAGRISASRYENYKLLYQELKERRRY